MKSVRSDEQNSIKYPCLMESSVTGAVFLMTDYNAGTMVHAGTSKGIVGNHSMGWNPSVLVPYNGTIILSN